MPEIKDGTEIEPVDTGKEGTPEGTVAESPADEAAIQSEPEQEEAVPPEEPDQMQVLTDAIVARLEKRLADKDKFIGQQRNMISAKDYEVQRLAQRAQQLEGELNQVAPREYTEPEIVAMEQELTPGQMMFRMNKRQQEINQYQNLQWQKMQEHQQLLSRLDELGLSEEPWASEVTPEELAAAAQELAQSKNARKAAAALAFARKNGLRTVQESQLKKNTATAQVRSAEMVAKLFPGMSARPGDNGAPTGEDLEIREDGKAWKKGPGWNPYRK